MERFYQEKRENGFIQLLGIREAEKLTECLEVVTDDDLCEKIYVL